MTCLLQADSQLVIQQFEAENSPHLEDMKPETLSTILNDLQDHYPDTLRFMETVARWIKSWFESTLLVLKETTEIAKAKLLTKG